MLSPSKRRVYIETKLWLTLVFFFCHQLAAKYPSYTLVVVARWSADRSIHTRSQKKAGDCHETDACVRTFAKKEIQLITSLQLETTRRIPHAHKLYVWVAWTINYLFRSAREKKPSPTCIFTWRGFFFYSLPTKLIRVIQRVPTQRLRN